MKKIIFLALLISAGYYFMNPSSVGENNPASNFLQSISALISDFNFSNLTKGSTSGTKTTVYKYQDENGQWHYSSEDDGKHNYQKIESYDANTNVIPAISTTSTSGDSPDSTASAAENDTDELKVSPLTVYTQPERVKKLIEDAKSVQQTLNDRKDTLDKQIDNP